LGGSSIQQISIETAQSGLDCAVLERLGNKAIILGVLDLSTREIETIELVASRIRRALPFVNPARLLIAPDCGLKYLPREVAFGKIKAMVDGARLVRTELEVAAPAKPTITLDKETQMMASYRGVSG